MLVSPVVGLGAPQTAWADEASARLGVRTHHVVAGDEQPAVVLGPRADVAKVEITMTRSDGKKQTLRATKIARGEERVLEVTQPSGSAFDYEAAFVVHWAEGDEVSRFNMRFRLTRIREMELVFDKRDVDLDARTLTFIVKGPAKEAELVLRGEGNAVLATVRKDLSKHVSGTKITLSYEDPGAEILVLDLKVYDPTGGYKGVRLTPVSTSIPHDDVVFDSGKWNIKAAEEPKLEATLVKVRAAIAKFEAAGVELRFKLFVAGYTDTVGSKASNQTLSTQRARSIARWFIGHGLRLDVYYQGFGEDVLAKRTPDETDEPENRRALYVLATQTPGRSSLFPRTNWVRAK